MSSLINNQAREITVSKFGGTSVADHQAMLRCAQIIKNDPANRVVVVSASSGVTNYLVRLSQANVSEAEQQQLLESIKNIQLNILAEIENSEPLEEKINGLLNELTAYAQAQSLNHSLRIADAILSFGEQMSSLLFAQVLQSIGVNGHTFDVKQIMKTNDLYGQAVVDLDKLAKCTATFLTEKLNDQVIVTQGFIGQTADGHTTTLGRGGSDYSAALIAEALGAKNLAIWTDVVGIFTTDPRITDQARAIKEISFGEAAEMATFGAKILHPATLIPAMRKNIPVFVGSSKEPEKGGTYIQQTVASKPTYRSISLRKEQTLVTVKSPAMLHASGFLAKVFAVLAKHELSVDLITTSEISVAMTFDNPSGSTQALLNSTVVEELEQLCEVSVENGLSLIAVVGNNIHKTNGVGTSIFDALSGINVRMICQGASEHNLCFLVNEAQANETVEKLHNKLFS
ncbi:lysine-sensitive aspartokinase 3 [Colwellia sp. 1_MG-2023]|uniref:lysine-sensitive aspartokinase 3 n=1 Tax=Colwellia sp. 1_MG-2023 TaxID=3062649 RepID=UPI0026E1650B|nr:lysine-sensitive aspartokinase 3 [Colwellia sp. 1_MG-2023]MDO6447282.1 lysine-sensitive aspartokinase 3 [Colwellia sp. 1_MG-2023]